MNRTHGGPFGNVQPDDPPMAHCNQCGLRYNPYKHGLGKCPECED